MTTTGDPHAFRRILPEDLEGKDLYFMLNSVIVPRPIAWVTSVAADGTHNAAPHSFCTIVSDRPPVIAFVSIGDKDTVRNVRATGDFVVHVVTRDLVERMNVTAADAPPDVSELELAGLESVPSSFVRSRRIVASPVAIECTVRDVQEIGRGRLVLGDVVAFHVAEHVFNDKDRVDPELLDTVARMGASDYATTRDRFQLRRPTFAGLTSGEPAPLVTTTTSAGAG